MDAAKDILAVPAKDILAKPYVSHYLKWEYWPYYLAALLVAALLLLLVLLVLRRRTGFAPGRLNIRKHVPGGLLDKQEHMPRSSLKKVWKRFLAQIPRNFRRAIQTYRAFIVMGEAGSGKSVLIDNFTDWRGQSNRFYPSYTVDPLLQIYLGTRALVMEIPAPLLNNTFRQARNALLKLWKPLFEKREATVVVALNGPALLHELPENARKCAQMVRGKINILSNVQDGPVKVHIALTHMDQVGGYAEFRDFLRAENIRLDIDPGSCGFPDRPASCLEPYEALLPRILTGRSSDDYLRVVSFFRTAPEILTALSAFAKTLTAPDPLSPVPRIERICLTSRGGNDAPGSNPFLEDVPFETTRKTIPNLGHRLAASLLLGLGALYLGANYCGERAAVTRADETLHLIDVSPLQQYNEYSHGLFTSLSHEMKTNIWLQLPPTFNPGAQEEIREHFVQGVRKFYLLPSFASLKNREDAQESGIYLLGLLYAANGNDLGKLVLANAGEWQKALGLPVSLITDYIRNNNRIEDIAVDLSALPMARPSREGLSDNPLPWILFFKKIKKACDEPSVNKEYLLALQKEADGFLKTVDRVSRYKLTNELVALLRRDTPIGAQLKWIQLRDALLEQEPLREFLTCVKQQNIEYPSVTGMGLSQFLESTKTMAKLGKGKEDKEYRIASAGEEFVFTAGKWNDLITRSRLTLFMREFVAQNKRTDGFLFFGKSSSIGYPDLLMNSSNDGLLFFVGKGRVDGRLTRSAFEQQVKPVLTELPELLQSLPVAEDEKKRFSQFILKQAETYADHYVAAYRSYYSQFRLSADSLGGLRYLLKQLQLPTSPFQDFLTSVKDNTVLDIGDSPYLRQFAKKLGTFEFVRRLMAEKEGALPEYEKYKAMLQQMDDELDSGEVFTVKNKADDANELKRILSPLGRISLAIQRGESDSYSSMVKLWLKSVGMDAEWQQPFVDPVMIAFQLGRSDVEVSIERVWSDLANAYVTPLYSKFPFNPKAEVEITPPELEKIVHPQGAFWKTFRDYLAPLCQENSGYWNERVTNMGTFRIPEGMLENVNEMSRLASVLWTDKGVAQPIVIQIRPAGLPPRSEHNPLAVLSYLRSDRSSVFAFNQQPAWQKLEIEWWKPVTSAVGVEFEAFADVGKSYREISISERYWSFHQLLGRAEIIDKSLLVWRVNGPAPYPQEVRIGFWVKSDPWAVFHRNQ